MNMKLSAAQIGATYNVDEIHLNENVKRRLQMLGMTNNTEITVLNRKYSGAVIIKMRGTRFALGRKYAEGISLTARNTK